ncbi:hypothetical protein N1029_19755, partial [Herbiconiux sp. CPCC 203406]|nr:hypothetical protein [Herbiconiux oxytropis]
WPPTSGAPAVRPVDRPARPARPAPAYLQHKAKSAGGPVDLAKDAAVVAPAAAGAAAAETTRAAADAPAATAAAAATTYDSEAT